MTLPDGHLKFVLDTNLGLPVDRDPWLAFLRENDIAVESTTDLLRIGRAMDAHEFDIGFVPLADLLRRVARGDRHYRGLAIATSKFTGRVDFPSVLVVRRDDGAAGLDDLAGSKYGYINKSCSSSYFPPAIMLHREGRRLDHVLHIEPVPSWQGQVDAVIAGRVRATMCPEDVWRTNPANAATTKVIGRFDEARAAAVVVRRSLDEAVARKILDPLVDWIPEPQAVYGAFRPFYFADVQAYYHDLARLPADF